MIIGIVLAVVCGVLFCFGFVLLFGAPFLPTLQPQIDTALDLLNLKQGDTLLELGCGDGRVLLAAVKRGYKAVGYELNPILVAISWLRTRGYGGQIRIVWGNYWSLPWPEAQGVFGFILPRYMGKLHKKVMRYSYRPISVASFAFTIPGRAVTRQKAGVYLYEYT